MGNELLIAAYTEGTKVLLGSSVDLDWGKTPHLGPNVYMQNNKRNVHDLSK